ncbi:MAG: type II toxin-antitoxin system PemK/MazF family toxin [Prevotellaceae bacterium]|jgi:mRNA interferase MazF|nr:type II toxin-antitoxin system PemK/MazF family toxin [Prevotellaceae bacterium]
MASNFNPQFGTEDDKTRHVLIIQTDILNKISHSSVIICLIITNVVESIKYLNVHLKTGTASLHNDCDIMIDQVRAIDSKRLIERL